MNGRFALLLCCLLVLPLAGARAADDEPSRADLEKQLAEARAQLNDAARRVGELSRELGQNLGVFVNQKLDGFGGNRPTLGLVIGHGSADEAMPTDGVDVLSVTPGGPADKAGIRADDVLLKIDEVSLAKGGAHALMDYLDGKQTGDEVTLTWRRGDDRRTARVKTEAPRNAFFLGDPRRFAALPDLEHLPHALAGPMAFQMMMNRWGDLELAPVSETLGSYFGVRQGLLVVRAPDEKGLELEDGDVIQKIGGRVPEDPAHALRILGSYRPGEKLDLEIVRHGKTQTLHVTMPETEIGMNWDWGAPGSPKRLIERKIVREGGTD